MAAAACRTWAFCSNPATNPPGCPDRHCAHSWTRERPPGTENTCLAATAMYSPKPPNILRPFWKRFTHRLDWPVRQ